MILFSNKPSFHGKPKTFQYLEWAEKMNRMGLKRITFYFSVTDQK